MTIAKKTSKYNNKVYDYFIWIVTYKPFRSFSLGRNTIVNRGNYKLVEAMIILMLNGAVITYFDEGLVNEAIRITDMIINRGWEEYVS